MRTAATLLLTAIASLPAPTAAQTSPGLMPVPREIGLGTGRLRLDTTFSIGFDEVINGRLRRGAARALARIAARTGLTITPRSGSNAATLLVTVRQEGEAVQTPDEDESYRLEIRHGGARLTASTVVGALRGLETVVQLVTPDGDGFVLPTVTVEDAPRFRWRGLLLDAGRHFMPPDVVKRTLDGMAAVKLNVLHWHLSEDQGFRVESRKFPLLHQMGSDGQYYTHDQIHEIVAYARDRGIRVVPEFDMPGHSTSWFVGYPEHASAPGPYAIERRFGVFEPAFDPTREETYEFLEQFVEEMAGLFPDPYWHIGGDEVHPRQWNDNPRIVAFRTRRSLKDNDALQAWFNQRVSGILARHGKRMIGWDEILHEGLPAGTVVQSWRGVEYLGRATGMGFSSILSAPYYLDQIYPADQHYLADPLPAGHSLSPAQAALVLGGEACMWAEHVSAETVDSRIWPRLAAVAERLWSPPAVQDVADMYRRLSVMSLHLERLGLGHEAHSARMLRAITGQRENPDLEELLRSTMPATFGQRGRIQKTTQLTPLTRLVDAARPDPWLRWQMIQLAGDRNPAALEALGRIFRGWKALEPRIVRLADSVPLAADGLEAARGLARLGSLGLEALDYFERGSATAQWKETARARLTDLAKPHGLLRLAGAEAVTVLVDAVPQPAE
ncbi:MAG: beta-N-acetylhexosaminidase [Gemmatimonadota bacterium]|nr:beta-N-acetylhexosaminidase [Gemmatimonadota bacterium]MDH4347320.1 beta-N-acetylhexosaminidase [Gemmatimonadota bacterium]